MAFGFAKQAGALTCLGCPCYSYKECEPIDVVQYEGGPNPSVLFIVERRSHIELLNKLLEQSCLENYAITSLVACNARSTTPKVEVDRCYPYLLDVIQQIDPVVLCPIGETVIEKIITPLWNGNFGGMKRWTGYFIPVREWNRFLHPLELPLTERDDRDFLKGLSVIPEYSNAVPYQRIPKEHKAVEVSYDIKEIKEALRYFGEQKHCAFDYETTAKKPHNRQKVYSVGISNGHRTMSFLMLPALYKAWRRFLQSDCKKIAHNVFFENLWSVECFKSRVNNWYWDTMLKGHMEDQRPGTKSLEFQAFVQFGIPYYANDIKHFLQAEKSNEPNRIEKAPVENLLVYGGIDALVTFQLFELQAHGMYTEYC